MEGVRKQVKLNDPSMIKSALTDYDPARVAAPGGNPTYSAMCRLRASRSRNRALSGPAAPAAVGALELRISPQRKERPNANDRVRSRRLVKLRRQLAYASPHRLHGFYVDRHD